MSSDGVAKIHERPKDAFGRVSGGFTDPEIKGRPDRRESQRRALHMAELVASGLSCKQAAAHARVSPWRALDLVDDPSWRSLVEGFKEAA